MTNSAPNQIAAVRFGLVCLVSLCLAAAGYGRDPFATRQIKDRVDVFYAIVPRALASEAVKSADAAARIEAAWISEGGPRFIAKDYVAVVFVHNGSGASPLYGVLKVWLPGWGPARIEVLSLAGSDASSLFVVDGGAVGGNPLREKRSEWESLKIRE